MIHSSAAYKKAIVKNREYRVNDKISFVDGNSIFLGMKDYTAYSINEATSASGKFEVGAAVIKEYVATLDNSDGRFDEYEFEGANLRAVIGLHLEDGTWEDVQKGTYRIVSAVSSDLTIQVKAYDSMLFLDKPYSESKLVYPATVSQIIQNVCTDCQVSFDAGTVEMGSYTVNARPSDDALTYRDVISYCAQIMGCYARIDHHDQLSFGWYHFDSIPKGLNGGVFDDDNPYFTGDIADGGSFDSYNSWYNYDAGEFMSLSNYHHFYDLKSQSISTDDICITGIQIEVKNEEDNTTKDILYGENGYVLILSGNPLIQSDSVSEVVQHVGKKLVGNVFRPLSISCQSDPCIEAGDSAIVTDRKQRSYITVITSTTFSLGSSQKIECSAETPTEKNYTKYSAETKILAESKEQTGQVLSAYDIAVQNMNQLAANTMGFYATSIKQSDGSMISYRHDKPKLSESKVVYKSGIDGFFVTKDYKGSDDATTAAGKWSSGFDSSGNATANILSVIGINFSWAHGGELTLGGTNNVNGEMKILDASGNLIGKWDKDGITATKGTFSGKLQAASGTFNGSATSTDGTYQAILDSGRLSGGKVGSALTGYVEFTVYERNTGLYGIKLAGAGGCAICAPSLGIADYSAAGASFTVQAGMSGSITPVTSIVREYHSVDLTVGGETIKDFVTKLKLTPKGKTLTFVKGLMVTDLGGGDDVVVVE